ncbi:hypothetical protein GXW71_05345 [Roseomonas hellenica]|uniref:Uncharacterized protein n=1 Tax=Plastoroseomonas hellenica TaxID=2687306 RepID=A0ABS5ETZ8_9PROT|nr:hypothetical protein [Plastoroseomonas hellenica]MBR0663778.1 hypothetical protein [Plastoroseomonas hellenica]
MMSSDTEYRIRLDRLADELLLAREEQRKMPSGAARDRRRQELDALEQNQDAIRRTLGLPLCRERVERAQVDGIVEAQAALTNAHRAERERLGLTPAQQARRRIAWLAGGAGGLLLLALLLMLSLD